MVYTEHDVSNGKHSVLSVQRRKIKTSLPKLVENPIEISQKLISIKIHTEGTLVLFNKHTKMNS